MKKALPAPNAGNGRMLLLLLLLLVLGQVLTDKAKKKAI